MKNLLLLLICALTWEASAYQWTQKFSLEASGRHRTCGVGYENRAFVGLGHYNGTGVETYFSDWWCYEPSSNSWSQKAEYPGNNGNGNLGCHCWVYNDYIYVGLGELMKRQFYRYSPATNTWELMPLAPSGINFQDTQELILGDKAYFTNIPGNNFYEYDCATGTWTLLGPLPVSWNYSYAGFSYDNKLWVKRDMIMYMYDPAVNQWFEVVSAGTFPGTAKRGHACFFVNDKFYVVCGYGITYSDVTSQVWEFDPSTLQWNQMSDFQGSSRRYTLGFSIGNTGYMATGTNGTNMNDLWEFNKFLGIDEIESFTVEAFPNPAIEQVTIQSKGIKSFEVVLYDLNGREIKRQETVNGSATIYKDHLPSGTYLYKVFSNNSEVGSDRVIFQ